MAFHVDVWVRRTNHASTELIAPVGREPQQWSVGDVAAVLSEMLRTLERATDPAAVPDRPIALRGFSWIVNPFETGGVVIALELSLGAVVAGPFDVPEQQLSSLIEQVMAGERAASTGSATVH